MTLVGIIANPASGTDIRRLVAYGSVFNNQEKVRIVRRILLGLEAAGVKQISYMPDYFGIVERTMALAMQRKILAPDVEPQKHPATVVTP
jgi:predicted polyphosphate/ATP-dependent NAD kinase